MTSETTSSAASRSRARANKKRAKRGGSSIEANTAADNGVDTAQLQGVLENLNIRFTGCTFTYKPTHLQAQGTPKRRSSMARLRSKISSTLDRVREAIVQDTTYNACVFFPNDEDKVKDFIHKNFSDIKLSFENCKFVGRGSTLLEKITRRLRKVFSVTFEIQYQTATTVIEHYTFRLKDVDWVYQQVQERLVEDE